MELTKLGGFTVKFQPGYDSDNAAFINVDDVAEGSIIWTHSEPGTKGDRELSIYKKSESGGMEKVFNLRFNLMIKTKEPYNYFDAFMSVLKNQLEKDTKPCLVVNYYIDNEDVLWRLKMNLAENAESDSNNLKNMYSSECDLDLSVDFLHIAIGDRVLISKRS